MNVSALISKPARPFNWSAVRGWEFNTIITLRGVVLLTFLFYLIFGPIVNEKDIVAAVFSYSLLSIALLFILLTILYGPIFKKDLGLELFTPVEQLSPSPYAPGKVYAGESSTFFLKTSEIRVPPLFSLNLEIEFEHENGSNALHRIIGFPIQRHLIREEIVFPHRGNWRIKQLSLRLEDRFGLSAFSWKINSELVTKSITVYPPLGAESAIPILSSCQRAGDTIVDMNERQGEPFDLKPYHPSDGVKRILWKVFAKRGELISRHPERSMTPEGQVAIFVVAGPQDDDVCSLAVSYLNRLQDLDLEIFLGCEGMQVASPARSLEEAQELLIESVWQAARFSAESLRRDLQTFLDTIQSSLVDAHIERILIFASSERIADSEALNSYINLGNFLEGLKIKPVWCLAARKDENLGSQRVQQEASESSFAKGVFYLQSIMFPEACSKVSKTSQYYREFLRICGQHGWQVIM